MIPCSLSRAFHSDCAQSLPHGIADVISVTSDQKILPWVSTVPPYPLLQIHLKMDTLALRPYPSHYRGGFRTCTGFRNVAPPAHTKKDTFCKVMQNVSFYNRLLSFSKIINRHFIAKTESLVRRGFPFQHAAALLINNLL